MHRLTIKTTSNQQKIKTPILITIPLPSHQPHPQQSPTPQIPSQSWQIPGQIHLYRNIKHNNPQQHEQSKLKLKSRAILVLGSQSIYDILKERIMEIQFCFVVRQYGVGEDYNFYTVVVFKTLVIAQEIDHFVQYQTLDLACLYLDSVLVVQVETLTTESNLDTTLQDHENWVQIPHCEKCLQILQPEVTGINLNQIHTSTQDSISISKCKVCWIRSRQESQCSQCTQIDDNWLCMVCGVVGCGRYKNADAFKHYTTSKHILSLDLKTNRIWNYQLDCFCHKIIGKEDGFMDEGTEKLIEEFDDDNMELQFWKYCNVVSEQLDKQRNFYNRIKDEEIQRYNAQEAMLNLKIEELTKIKEQKKENLKKKLKRNKKIVKRNNEIQEELKQQKQLKKLLQESASKGNQKPTESAAICKKKQQLQEIELQIQKLLTSISSA